MATHCLELRIGWDELCRTYKREGVTNEAPLSAMLGHDAARTNPAPVVRVFCAGFLSSITTPLVGYHSSDPLALRLLPSGKPEYKKRSKIVGIWKMGGVLLRRRTYTYRDAGFKLRQSRVSHTPFSGFLFARIGLYNKASCEAQLSENARPAYSSDLLTPCSRIGLFLSLTPPGKTAL